MIPVFVMLTIYYGQSVVEGSPKEWQRIAAIVVFVLAAASDGLDGYIARHYNQRSRLGVILDPIADKGLLLSALITLSFARWHYEFPIWFPVLVIARDLVVVIGAMLLHYFVGTVHVRPTWSGKTATALLMVSLAGAMLQLKTTIPLPWGGEFLLIDGLVLVTGLFTFVSGAGYVINGIRQLQAGGHTNHS